LLFQSQKRSESSRSSDQEQTQSEKVDKETEKEKTDSVKIFRSSYFFLRKNLCDTYISLFYFYRQVQEEAAQEATEEL